MKISLHSLWVLVAVFALRATAACTAYGVDYANGGSYNIDASSSDYFSFQTVFQGCTTESLNPVLVDPAGNQYVCTALNVTASQTVLTSTCGIPYSAMQSGQWKIILSGDEIAVQRVLSLTVGGLATVTITVTPTVVLGVTSTPDAITVFQTVIQTRTSVVVPATVTTACNDPTQVVTLTPTPPTVVKTSTIVRTVTDKSVTSTLFTTITEIAVCHLSTTYTSRPDTTPTPIDPEPTFCFRRRTCRPTWTATSGRGGGWGWNGAEPTAVSGEIVPDQAVDADKRDAAAIAAITVTTTETTFTATQTSVTTIAAATTTENVVRTTTTTLVPAPTTVCLGGTTGATITITRPYATVTQTDVVYSTSHQSVTVWVAQTAYSVISNPLASIICWRAGGSYGP